RRIEPHDLIGEEFGDGAEARNADDPWVGKNVERAKLIGQGDPVARHGEAHSKHAKVEPPARKQADAGGEANDFDGAQWRLPLVVRLFGSWCLARGARLERRSRARSTSCWGRRGVAGGRWLGLAAGRLARRSCLERRRRAGRRAVERRFGGASTLRLVRRIGRRGRGWGFRLGLGRGW